MGFTKQEHEDLLQEIARSGGDTPRMLELMQKLRDDFDEREGILRKEGRETDKEPPEGQKKEEAVIRKESEEDDKEDGGERRRAYGVKPDDVEDYEKLKEEYIRRFFSSPRQAARDQEEDIKKDGRSGKTSFDDLFKKREG